MGLINTIFNAIFDVMILPFRALHPLAGLAVVALVMAVVALLAFRYASNATAITRIKTRISAYLLEMRIYRDDLKVLLVDPARILFLNAKYVLHAFGPFLLILPPMLLAIFQIEARYGVRALELGERTLLTVAVADDVDVLGETVRLETSEGVRAETKAVRIPREREITWRLRAEAEGEHWVRVTVGDAPTVEKRIWVGTTPKAIAQARSARYAGFAALSVPAEAPLAKESRVVEIRVHHPLTEGKPLGLSTSVWIFFGLSTLFGFALKDVLGVTL